MSSIIKYSHQQNLIQIDDGNILLDCKYLDNLQDKRIDSILLSHGTLELTRNIPSLLLNNKYSRSHYRKLYDPQYLSDDDSDQVSQQINIYSTWPVAQMAYFGWINCQFAHFESTGEPLYKINLDQSADDQMDTQENVKISNIEELQRSNQFLKAIFNEIVQVKYHQSICVFKSNKSMVIATPVRAGYSIGGSVWKLVTSDAPLNQLDQQDGSNQVIYTDSLLGSNDTVLYMPIVNHRKDRHLNGVELLTKVNVLLTGSGCLNIFDPEIQENVVNKSSLPRSTRDKMLINTIMETLNGGGDVLIPAELTKILEISLLLDQLWSIGQLSLQHDIYLVLPESLQNVLEIVKGMMEWMGDAILAHFESTRESLYNFKFIKVVQSNAIELIFSQQQRKSVCVITLSSMLYPGETSHKIFSNYFQNMPQNLLLFCQRPQVKGTLGDLLFNDAIIKGLDKISCNSVQIEKQDLSEEELKLYNLEKEEQNAKKEAEEAVKLRKEKLLNAQLLEEDEDVVQNLTIAEKFKNDQVNSNQVEDVDRILFKGRFDWVVMQNQQQADEDILMLDDFHERPVSFPSMLEFNLSDQYGEIMDYDPIRKLQQSDQDVVMQEGNVQIGSPVESQPFIQPEIDVQLKLFKISAKTQKVNVQCQIKYIDFESISDPKSILNLIAHIQPKKVVLLDDSEDLNVSFQVKQVMLETQPQSSVYLCDQELLNLSSDVNVLKLKMTDALISSVQLKRFNDMEVGYFSGVIQMVDNFPVLDIAPSNVKWISHEDVPIGDVKLTELRSILGNKYQCDFERGNLVITDTQNKISVRVVKDPDGAFVIEGSYSKLYWKVRKTIYNMHAIV